MVMFALGSIRRSEAATPRQRASATLVFALGSIWRSEAVFGCILGVIRTSASYAGSSKPPQSIAILPITQGVSRSSRNDSKGRRSIRGSLRSSPSSGLNKVIFFINCMVVWFDEFRFS
ncbi:hypothetical protein E2562_016719 [Oryza meyeriana var. granulata]|uniref:Uncharacterized protein n=1 Tax=Oryza meyeriana var. granulata TaxID=110450 RepID=A0A6G1ELX2_9ORYZ|nr:hypothetical protein E2562_016719 [Oryza meyeriana var. granulata]